MGAIARAVRSPDRTTSAAPAAAGWRPHGDPSSQRLWDHAFRRPSGPYTLTSLPDGVRKPDVLPIRGRSLAMPNEIAFKRLLDSLRSDAPGGWTDDRYEQTLRHFTGITYVAIHRLSTQLARAEFQVFREDPAHPDGRKPVGRNDPDGWDLVQLLKKPNGKDTFGKLMYRWSLQRRLTGTALTWMVPNRMGRPFELYSIPTALAIPQAATNPLYPNGYYRIQPVYPYGPFSTWPSATTSVGAAIPAEWMLRFQYPHPLLHYEGYSPLTGMRLHIDAIEMIDRARHSLMRRGVHPNAVASNENVEGAEELTEDQIDQMRAMFEEDHQGPENVGRLLFAYAGWKLEQWGQTPDKMGFDSSWDQLMSFILGGGFGITKPAAGMIDDASYGGLFATMKQLHLVTLEPECEELSGELTRHVAPFFGDDLIIDVRLPRIDDHEIKFSKLAEAARGKAITKNELRQELGLPLTHEPWGGDFAGELNVMPADVMQQIMTTQMGAPLAGPQVGMPPLPPGQGGVNDPSALAGGGNPELPPQLQSPGTGGLGANSLGPRPGKPLDMEKSLGRLAEALGDREGVLAKGMQEIAEGKGVRKSFYHAVREALHA